MLNWAMNFVADVYHACSGWLYEMFDSLNGFEQLILVFFCAAVTVRLLLMPLVGGFASLAGRFVRHLGSDQARSRTPRSSGQASSRKG